MTGMGLEEFTKQKKICITQGYFYVFLGCLLIIVLVSTLGLIIDLTQNLNEQIHYHFSLASDKKITSDQLNTIKTTQVIKFVTIIIFSIAFCVSIWLGVRKLAYGYAFTIIYLFVFSLFFAYPFIMTLKPFWNDIVQMTFSLIIIIALLFWGFRQKLYRATLRNKLLQQKWRSL